MTDLVILGIISAGLSSFWILASNDGMILNPIRMFMMNRLFNLNVDENIRITYEPKYWFSRGLFKVLFLCTYCNSTWINIIMWVYGMISLGWNPLYILGLIGITTVTLKICNEFSD